MIATIFLRIATMIAVLIKCTIYEDCDHDCSPHKNIMFLSLIGLRCSPLYEDYDHYCNIHKIVLYLSLYEDCDHDRSLQKRTAIEDCDGRSPHKCPIFEFL